MATEVVVPRRGWSMDEGQFVEWRKRDGDTIRAGEILFTLESEKAIEEIEAETPGILRIPPNGPRQGETIKVGQVLAFLVAPGEAMPEQIARSAVGAAGIRPSVAVAAKQEVKMPAHGQSASSPRARRIARELGIDWRNLSGTGHGGRVRERDVRTAALATSERPQPKHTLRKAIAVRMLAGVTQAAPVTLTTKVDATNLVNLRRQFHVADAVEIVPSYTDIIVKLVAGALTKHPHMLAQWRDDQIVTPDHIDIAVAVDTDFGLTAPVVRTVDRLTLQQVAKATKELIAIARAGRLAAEHLRHATFTVTNLGSYGIDAFTPIISLPQSAVLGIGCIAREPAVCEDQIVVRDRMTLSLTFDHRITDGAPAAQFLAEVRKCLEHPAPWLVH